MAKNHKFEIGDRVLTTKVIYYACETKKCISNPCPTHVPTIHHSIGLLTIDLSYGWTLLLENGQYDTARYEELLPIPLGATPDQIEALKSLLT